MRTTNYHNTFVAVAENCRKMVGTVPPKKTPPTVAQLTFDIVSQNPYQYSSDEILLQVHRQRNDDFSLEDYQRKSQACFRCSPLSKTYGWGFHFNGDWKVAIYGMESQEYHRLLHDTNIKQRRAFSSKK
ncbi:DUF6157 family protein [Eionea flava]